MWQTFKLNILKLILINSTAIEICSQSKSHGWAAFINRDWRGKMSHGPYIAAVCDHCTCADSWALMEEDTENELSDMGNVGYPIKRDLRGSEMPTCHGVKFHQWGHRFELRRSSQKISVKMQMSLKVVKHETADAYKHIIMIGLIASYHLTEDHSLALRILPTPSQLHFLPFSSSQWTSLYLHNCYFFLMFQVSN